MSIGSVVQEEHSGLCRRVSAIRQVGRCRKSLSFYWLLKGFLADSRPLVS